MTTDLNQKPCSKLDRVFFILALLLIGGCFSPSPKYMSPRDSQYHSGDPQLTMPFNLHNRDVDALSFMLFGDTSQMSLRRDLLAGGSNQYVLGFRLTSRVNFFLDHKVNNLIFSVDYETFSLKQKENWEDAASSDATPQYVIPFWALKKIANGKLVKLSFRVDMAQQRDKNSGEIPRSGSFENERDGTVHADADLLEPNLILIRKFLNDYGNGIP